MGISDGRVRTRRLPDSVRCQQHLREQHQSRIRAARLPGRHTGAPCAADSHCRSRRSRRLHHRHPRSPGGRSGMEPVCRSRAPLRSGIHHDRARRQHPAARRTGRGTGSRASHRCNGGQGGRLKSLPDLQSAFQGFILANDPAIRNDVVGTAKVDIARRLAIYADAYRLRLIEALDTDYPGLHTMAGDQEFDRLARAYIDAQPSAFRSLRWFGNRLSEFLRATTPYSDYPVYAEMAAFEWAMSDAFDAADSTVAAVDDMAVLPPDVWPGLVFALHASVQRLDLRWNV